MKRTTVRILCMLVVMSMLAALVTACGGATATTTTEATTAAETTTVAETTAEKLEQVTLTILTGGEQPDQPGFQGVSDEIAKLTADNINVKIDVQTYAWGDYFDKLNTMLAAQQKIDIYLSFTGVFQQDADKKQIIPVGDLVDKYGADLKRVIPADVWADGSYKEEIYAIPALYTFVGIWGMLIRGDLREKYNLPPVTDLTSYENYLDAVVKGEKGMIGFTNHYDLSDFLINKEKSGEQGYLHLAFAGPLPVARMFPGKPYKAENRFATPEMKKVIDWNRKAYANGWEAKDTLVAKDIIQLFMTGKVAAIGGDIFVYNNIVATMEKNIPGSKIEIVTTHDYKNVNFKRTTKINNFAVITSTSKNPDRAMMFLNWTRATQNNYNLMMYGIKGKDWVPVGNTAWDVGPGIDPAKLLYNPTPWWFKNMTMDLLSKQSFERPEYVKFYNNIIGAKFITPKAITFMYDSAAMKTQLTQIATMILEKWNPVMAGIKNTDADYQEALAALDKAGVAEVVADIQKQLDAWATVNDPD